VLNAAQELLNSEVTLVTARRDAYVAAFALLAAMGRAEASDLGLSGPALRSDPDYNRVRNRVSDFAFDPNPVAYRPRPPARRPGRGPDSTLATPVLNANPAPTPPR
jgi:outer membrane protein